MNSKAVADIYPLAPLQQGMLFHSLLAPHSGAYIVQVCFTIYARLNQSTFVHAWQQALQRHAVLRTAFVWENLDQPLQVVGRQVTVPISTLDWQNFSPDVQQNQFATLLQEQRCQGFVLTKAPLMRLTIIQMQPAVYQVVWCYHHALLDGWSVPLLLQEVLTDYDCLSQGQTSLITAPRPYRDYIGWLQQQDVTAAEQFWRQILAEFYAPTPLGVDHPLPLSSKALNPQPTYQEQSSSLSVELTTQLRDFAYQHQLTLNTLTQAAYALLLSCYSGESDVVFGITSSGRPAELLGAESMIGLFINTLPLRVKVDTQIDLLTWLKQIQSQQVELRQYEYTSLIDIQRWSGVPRSSRLFESLFIFENYPISPQLHKSLAHSNIQNIHTTEQTDYPLTIYVVVNQVLTLRILYDCERFSSDVIERMLGHLQTLLAGIVSQSARVSDLSLLTEAEQQQQRVWNQTAVEFPNTCLPQLFETQAAHTPDAVAVRCADAALTYRTLNSQANQLAHHLLSFALPPHTPIALCVERSLEMLVALLAILKAGYSYLPIDPSLPSQRIAFLLSDANPPLLLTTTSLHSGLSAQSTSPTLPQPLTILLDQTPLSHLPPANPTIPLSPQQPAYLLYTSGSTGTPKAVQILHASLANFLHAMQHKLCLSADATLLAVTTLSFDIAALELFLPLIRGATVVIAPRETTLDGGQLAQAISQHSISLMQATPATWRLLLLAGWQGKADLTILCGGEALEPTLAATLLKSGKALWNLYGPTETTVWSTAYRVETVPTDTAAISIGQPLANQQCYVLDGQQQPVAVGVVGELYIGGAGLANGYYNRPALSAERFVPTAGGRLYRTGDRVRYRAEGGLEYLGRVDEQVKLRGYRIELGEIEAVLRQHEAVEAGVVVKRQTAAVGAEAEAEEQLVAYVVASKQQESVVGALWQQMRATLPVYMLPSAIVVLDELPLTPNGKLDRRALPAPEKPIASTNSVIPRTPIEELLVNIWKDILALETVNIEDNFFELGGHSLLATRVIARIRDTFQIELPLHHLFEQPTIAALAAIISTAQTGRSLPPIAPSEHQTLSFAQQRLWFLAQLEPDSPFYNIPAAIQLTGALNVAILRRCFATVVQRHQVLRTAFLTVDGQPVLTVYETIQLDLPLIDLSGLPAAIQTQQFDQFAQTEAMLPFAIDQTPLLRLKLLRLSPDCHVLLLTLHHIVADGRSIDVLLREVATLYAAFQQKQPDPLPDLPIQFADFADWQRRWLQGDVLEQQLTYWQQQLQNLPALLELPTDRPRPAQPSSRGSSFTFSIAPDTTQALRQLSQQFGCTLFMTLLAAFQLLLHRYTDSDDIAVGTPIANRSHSATESLIGCFANTLVLRTDLSGNPQFSDLLQRVKQVALGAYSHQDLPFEQLVEALQPQRSLSYSPLFQVMFSFQSASPSLAIEGLTWSTVPRSRQTAKFDLTLAVTETEHELVNVLEYSLDLFEPATIERLAGHFQTLIAAIVHQPDCRISDLSLLTPTEQQQLAVWNQTDSPYPNICIHQLFEAQVERTPEAIALIWQDQHLTYRQLNAKANQLAHYLIQLGAQPDIPIALCLDRSADLIISLLGILKAGAAYLPIDPTYPAERQAFMLQDAEAKLLITCSPTAPLLHSSASRHCHPLLHLIELNTWNPTPYNSDNPNQSTDPANLAYLVYTSGSTGLPKAVAIEHRNTIALLHWALHSFPPHSFATTLAATSLCFDLSVFEIFSPLTSGGAVLLADSPLSLPYLPHAHHLSLLNTVPAAAAALLRLGALPPSIHTVTLAGEALPQSLVQQLYQLPSIQQVYNLYGPSEDTTYSTAALVTPEQTTPPIGRPIANRQAHLLDRYGNRVPVGVVGELYLSGAGVSRGYYNRPANSAERFVPSKGGVRLYRTGDRCRYLANGELEYLGRVDDQVKLRGFRIELGEIEACLNQHPAIQQAIAHLWIDSTEHSRLIAYIIPTPHTPHPTPHTLRTFLQPHLPDYMVPAAFVLLDRFPLTPNGKIDRRALPAPDFPTPHSPTQPHSPIEQTLLEIWQQVLGVETIGVEDNFFERGGDSILAIQVIAQASQAGLHLLPKHLFQAQTIAELAGLVNQTKSVQADQGCVTGEIPLTPIQRWFFEQNWLESHHWNQALLLEVGQLNPLHLEQALRHLFCHHDALRLRFYPDSETGWQQVNASPEPTLPFTVIDLAALAPDQHSSAIETIATELQASLNLSQTPVRIVLFQCDIHPDRLLWICHHLLVDGVSWRILLADLQTLYQQAQQRQMAQLPPKTTSFQQWANSLQAAAHSDWQQAIDYWRTIQPASPLPQDFPQGSNTVADLEIISVTLNATATAALLQDVPAAYQTQINDALLTALLLAFADWTGTPSLLLELEGHGREAELIESKTNQTIDLSRTVGWFTTLFPVWLNLESNQVGAALKAVKEQLRAIPQRRFSYGLLRYLTDADPQLTQPHPQVRFNYLGQLDQALQPPFAIAKESIGLTRSPAGHRDVLLEINALIVAGELRLNWGYSRAIHRPATIETLAKRFINHLQDLIQHCQSTAGGYTPSDFPLMDISQTELDELLSEL